jgi:hypothetical protein
MVPLIVWWFYLNDTKECAHDERLAMTEEKCNRRLARRGMGGEDFSKFLFGSRQDENYLHIGCDDSVCLMVGSLLTC